MSDPGFPDLRAFLDQLRRDGDLVVVDAPVDARLEAAEIHRRVIAAGGPALLFTNVAGADFPLVTNLFGTRAPRGARLRHAARSSSSRRLVAARARRSLPPTPAKLWGARDLARRSCCGSGSSAAPRAGHRGRDRATCGSTGCRR